MDHNRGDATALNLWALGSRSVYKTNEENQSRFEMEGSCWQTHAMDGATWLVHRNGTEPSLHDEELPKLRDTYAVSCDDGPPPKQ